MPIKTKVFGKTVGKTLAAYKEAGIGGIRLVA